MRPSPIPDGEIWPPDARRIVVAPPDGDLLNPLIAPVEALASVAPDGAPCLSVRCVLEPGDLEALQAGAVIWLTFYGGAMPPFAFSMGRSAGGENG